MFKILIALSLFLAIQGQLIGGYTDRPDLVKSPVTQSMVKLAVAELAQRENLQVTPVQIVNVGTQVVNGVNFLVVFSAEKTSTTDVVLCTAKIYQPIEGPRSLTSVECA